mmetsp:Transcript_21870/g.73801  ORF Transcript_21870/g.73801 Transcript_21870/m.73801 type:complete len:262 (-) Transcript_21870:748-1533(-)
MSDLVRYGWRKLGWSYDGRLCRPTSSMASRSWLTCLAGTAPRTTKNPRSSNSRRSSPGRHVGSNPNEFGSVRGIVVSRAHRSFKMVGSGGGERSARRVVGEARPGADVRHAAVAAAGCSCRRGVGSIPASPTRGCMPAAIYASSISFATRIMCSSVFAACPPGWRAALQKAASWWSYVLQRDCDWPRESGSLRGLPCRSVTTMLGELARQCGVRKLFTSTVQLLPSIVALVARRSPRKPTLHVACTDGLVKRSVPVIASSI